MERRRDDFIKPEFMYFKGTTDEDGRLTVNFIQKPCHYTTDYEVAVDSMSLDMSTFKNILESDRDPTNPHFTFIESSSSSSTKIYLPESKIATFGEFVEKVNEVQSKFTIKINYLEHKSEIDIGKNKLEVDKRMARVLGLLNTEQKVSKIIQDINSSSCTFTVLKKGKEVIGVRLDPTSGDGKAIQIAKRHDHSVWSEISPSSFQFILVDCDFVIEEMVGKERTQNLEMVPFNTLTDHYYYSPERLTWKRINSNVFFSCFIRFADTRGRRFKGAEAVCQLRIRRRQLR